MHQIATPLRADVPHCAPKHRPQLVETRGVPTGQRATGAHPSMLHIECALCGVATVPTTSRALAESRWVDPAGTHRVPLWQLPRVREAAFVAQEVSHAA